MASSKSATILVILIAGLTAGPAVSLYGSPTVSPVTDGLMRVGALEVAHAVLVDESRLRSSFGVVPGARPEVIEIARRTGR